MKSIPESDIAMHRETVLLFAQVITRVRNEQLAAGLVEFRDGVLVDTAKGLAFQEERRKRYENYSFRPKRRRA